MATSVALFSESSDSVDPPPTAAGPGARHELVPRDRVRGIFAGMGATPMSIYPMEEHMWAFVQLSRTLPPYWHDLVNEIAQEIVNQGGLQFPTCTRPQEDFLSLQRRRYAARLNDLQDLSRDEGICPVISGSEKDFFDFLNTRGFPVRRASLALLDDGTLGATWRNEQWRLGLRFCGDGQIEYVLLDRTNPPEGATGASHLENFSVDYDQLNLRALLAE